MKIARETMVFMVFSLLWPLKLQALPDIENPVPTLLAENPFKYHPYHQGFSYGQPIPLEISYEAQSVKVDKNAFGVRELDMTNMCHFNLARSRLDKAEISEEEFPLLYRNLELKQQQQHLEKLFPTPMQITSVSDKHKGKNASHSFLAMNVAISPQDNSPYLIIHTKNSVPGGTFTTYLDLLLENSSGEPLVPMEHTLEFYEGEDTTTSAIVSLAKLKQSFPALEMIHASSYVETQSLDGTIASAIKHSRYPFSWADIEQAFGDLLGGDASPGNTRVATTEEVSGGGLYQYPGLDAVEQHGQGHSRICLGAAIFGCEQKAKEAPSDTGAFTVKLPFSG